MSVIRFPLPDPVGYDDIPVECKAEFQRAMARHPAGGRGRVSVPPQEPATPTPVPGYAVLCHQRGIGTFLACSAFVGAACLLFLLYFGLVK